MQQINSLLLQVGSVKTHPRDIPSRSIEARDESDIKRVDAENKHDRDGRSCFLYRVSRFNSHRCNHCDLSVCEFPRFCGKLIVTAGHRMEFDGDVAIILITSLRNAFLERRIPIGASGQHGNNRKGLLRSSRNGRRRAAEQRDEFAPTDHSITSSARASSIGGTSRPSNRAVEALMTSSNLVDWTTGSSSGFAPLRMRPVKTPSW